MKEERAQILEERIVSLTILPLLALDQYASRVSRG